MYGHQEVMFFNKKLKYRMEQENYYELPHTSGLCKHSSLNTMFTLVVNEYEIKYQSIDNANHIIQALQYTV